MEGESNGMEGSRQCQAGCGFFGSPATDGLCSMCYREVVKKKQQPPTGSYKVPSPQRAAVDSAVNSLTTSISFLQQQQQQQQQQKTNEEKAPSEETAAVVVTETIIGEEASTSITPESPPNADNSGSDSKKKSNRCLNCRKKVGLTGFECRCGGLFCSTHRYSDKHNCTFDYRQLGAEEIRKNNPVVVSEKINKI